jgi:RNA polymerase sigma factor (sigma-70 family)
MEAYLPLLLPRLESIARKLTTDLHLQEDLLQEMILHLHQQWQENPDRTLSWYAQSCHFHASKYLNAGRSIDSKARADMEAIPFWQEAPDGGLEPLPIPSKDAIEEEVAVGDLLEKIRHALMAKQARVLDFLVAGYTEKEIGMIEGVSREAIHQQKKRIQQIAKGVLVDA